MDKPCKICSCSTECWDTDGNGWNSGDICPACQKYAGDNVRMTMLKACKICLCDMDHGSGDLCPVCQTKALDDLARQNSENARLLDIIATARAEAERSAIMSPNLHVEFVKERVQSLASAVVALANVAEVLTRRTP